MENMRLIQELEQAEARQREKQRRRAQASQPKKEESKTGKVSSTWVNAPPQDLKPGPTPVEVLPVSVEEQVEKPQEMSTKRERYRDRDPRSGVPVGFGKPRGSSTGQ